MSQPLPADGGDGAGLYGPPNSTGDEPANRLAQAIRRISGVVVGLEVPDVEMALAADQLTRIADVLEASASPPTISRIGVDLSGHPQDFFPTSPIVGYANPIAPPVEVWAVEGDDGRPEVRGRVTYGHPYEGPPSCVHGGVIAELFDELMGVANVVAHAPAMTGTLTVRYHRPTPLLAELDLAARFTGSERRKIFTWAGIYLDGELTAEAEGIFISVQPDRVQNIVLANDRAARASARAADADATS